MGRSNGYRPKAAVRDEVLALRAKLAELTDDQWQKASCIMDNITALLGKRCGPSNGKIEPRACRYCHHYGHTRQWCPKRLAAITAREEREADELLAEDRALGVDEWRMSGYGDTEWGRWLRLADEAHRDLCKIKEVWTDEEWKTEFFKRTGEFDFVNQRIILTHQAPLAAPASREEDPQTSSRSLTPSHPESFLLPPVGETN